MMCECHYCHEHFFKKPEQIVAYIFRIGVGRPMAGRAVPMPIYKCPKCGATNSERERLHGT